MKVVLRENSIEPTTYIKKVERSQINTDSLGGLVKIKRSKNYRWKNIIYWAEIIEILKNNTKELMEHIVSLIKLRKLTKL